VLRAQEAEQDAHGEPLGLRFLSFGFGPCFRFAALVARADVSGDESKK
jgi:hypothetical protein